MYKSHYQLPSKPTDEWRSHLDFFFCPSMGLVHDDKLYETFSFNFPLVAYFKV
jgi:hypothetical protein